MPWASGQKLQGGKYTIEQVLGEGGFGITYRARDHNGRCIVIKTLNDKVQGRPDFATIQPDFLNQAVRFARCSHPHLVRIDEVVQEGVLWCIVMEYIDGEDLAHRVVNRGALPEAEALHYIQQIGAALTQVVHSNGLLHRNIKPHNILLRSGNNDVVLIDFGIAREFTPNLTQTHAPFFFDGFAPIEQYDKRANRGAYTDIYALSATLYSLLTAQVPPLAALRIAGMPLEVPQQINSSISDRVNHAILKGMEVKAEDRPQSVDEWLALMDIKVAPTIPVVAKASPVKLISARGVDYRKLRDLLAAGQWKEADEETASRMLEVVGQTGRNYLLAKELETFPCEDLHTLDQLWVHYSEGHFGFSVQNRIWQSVNNDKDEFGEQVGWYVNDNWLIYEDLTFTLNATQGHLPYGSWRLCKWAVGGVSRLFLRLKICKI